MNFEANSVIWFVNQHGLGMIELDVSGEKQMSDGITWM
jgi:hypothetical protein